MPRWSRRLFVGAPLDAGTSITATCGAASGCGPRLLGDVAPAARLGNLVARRRRKAPGAVCARRPARRVSPRRVGFVTGYLAFLALGVWVLIRRGELRERAGRARADRRRRPPWWSSPGSVDPGGPRHRMDQPERLPSRAPSCSTRSALEGSWNGCSPGSTSTRAVPDHHAARLARDRGGRDLCRQGATTRTGRLSWLRVVSDLDRARRSSCLCRASQSIRNVLEPVRVIEVRENVRAIRKQRQ